MGFKYLTADLSDFSSHLPVTFSTYDHDEVALDDLFTPASRYYPAPEYLFDDTPDLPTQHTSHYHSIAPVLDRLRVPHEALLRSPSALFTDYEPWIRFMTAIDDTRITEFIASGLTEGTTRRTRNSQRSQQDLNRWLHLDEDDRDVLSRTALQRDPVTSGDPTLSVAGTLLL